jgi:hypothetical protein
MEKCYRYIGCDKTDCVMYEKDDETKCWDVQGTLCNHPGMELMEKKSIDKCKYCIYYKEANWC